MTLFFCVMYVKNYIFFFVHKKQVFFFFFFLMFKNTLLLPQQVQTPLRDQKKRVFFLKNVLFLFSGRVQFYIRLEDPFKHYIALAHCPRTQYQRRQNEYAYKCATCDFGNHPIHHLCIKRMCKYLFFYIWLANARF